MTQRITHEDIAVEPTWLNIPKPNYDHKLQRNVDLPTLTGMGTPTFNGTRTFNSQGSPSDSDQDNDRSS